jgi:hypothetical protein
MELGIELNWLTFFYLYGLIYMGERVLILIKRRRRIKNEQEQEVMDIDPSNAMSHVNWKMILSLSDLFWLVVGVTYTPYGWLFLGILALTYLPFIASIPKGNNFDFIKKGFVIVTISKILIAGAIIFNHFYFEL